MDEIKLIFQSDERKIEMTFPKKITVEDALTQFLIKTNSIINLSVNHIVFVCGPRVLNIPSNLKKTLSVLKANQCTIKVVDQDNILAGGGYPVDFCDISRQIHEDHTLTSDGPSYRTTGKGINIYGKCRGREGKKIVLPMIKK